MPRIAPFCLAAGLILLAVAPGASAAADPRATAIPRYSSDGIVLRWLPGADRGERAAARAEADVAFVDDLGNRRFQLVETEPGRAPDEAIAVLEGNPAVALAARDGYSAPAAIPNDPLYEQEWGLENLGTGVGGFSGASIGADIDAPGAWSRTVGTPSTVVADIDSGYRFDSPDLGPVAWVNPGEVPGNGSDDDGNGLIDDVHGYDLVGANPDSPSQDDDPTDDDLISGGHGVHTAGTIGAAGNDGFGITGVAQDVRMMPLRVCANKPGLDEPRCPDSSIIAAINYAGANGARVANISLSGTTANPLTPQALAENPGTLFVVAAGNDGQDNDSAARYPCNYEPSSTGIAGAIDNVVCVAATDQADALAGFSDRGHDSVDLGAPGTEILSTYPAIEELFGESFEQEDFELKWTPTGANGGFARTDEEPLTSFGISDSPGATPDANSGRSSTLSDPVAVPAGYGACRLSGRELAALEGGTFTVFIFKDGFSAYTFQIPSTGGSQIAGFQTTPMTDLAESNVGIRVRYLAGPAPTSAAGVWLDDLRLSCYAPIETAPTYAFLQGTSMAAAHVSGAAALLFSEEPGASVTEVREALLTGAEPAASLAGQTVTGGRLNIPAAMDALEAGLIDDEAPEAPLLSATDPVSPASEGEPKIVGSAEAGAAVDVYLGADCEESPIASGTAEVLASPGIAVAAAEESTSQFSATATDAVLNTSPCSDPISYTRVPPPDTEAPAAPVLATDPPSPAAVGSPRIVGTAEAESTVAIFLGASCGGSPLSTTSAEKLASPGISVDVPQESGRTYSATATDAAFNISPCSAPISYTNTSMIGFSSVIVIEPPLPPGPPAPQPTCKVPKLVGRTLGQARAALAGAGCRVGKVTRPRTRAGRKPPALVVRSSSPSAGSSAPGAIVALTLGPKPKRQRH